MHISLTHCYLIHTQCWQIHKYSKNNTSLQLPSTAESMGSASSSTFSILTSAVLNSSLKPHPDTARGSWTGQLLCSLLRKGSSMNWKKARGKVNSWKVLKKATELRRLTLSLSRLRRISLVSSSVSLFSFLILMMGEGPTLGASLSFS